MKKALLSWDVIVRSVYDKQRDHPDGIVSDDGKLILNEAEMKSSLLSLRIKEKQLTKINRSSFFVGCCTTAERSIRIWHFLLFSHKILCKYCVTPVAPNQSTQLRVTHSTKMKFPVKCDNVPRQQCNVALSYVGACPHPWNLLFVGSLKICEHCHWRREKRSCSGKNWRFANFYEPPTCCQLSGNLTPSQLYLAKINVDPPDPPGPLDPPDPLNSLDPPGLLDPPDLPGPLDPLDPPDPPTLNNLNYFPCNLCGDHGNEITTWRTTKQHSASFNYCILPK